MSWLEDKLGDAIHESVEGFRESTFPKVRNWMAQQADLLGGTQSDADAKKILHEQGNYNLTKKIAGLLPFLPPEFAANVSDLGYLGNETLTGVMAKATGRPFFSDYGFRWKDVAINRRGQDRALEELNAQRDRDYAGMRRTFRGVE